MPIKPENLARYPPDWPQIRERIRARARDCCEQCGVRNHVLGGRLPDGRFLHAHALGESMTRLLWPQPGAWWWCGPDSNKHVLRIIRIVCTVAHLDHVPEHCDDDNLRFLCQRCHLLHDLQHHKETAYATRRQGKAIDMFEVIPS